MLDNEIIEIFRNISVEESIYAPSFTIECLLQIDVVMKDGHTITIYCDEKTLVDCSGLSPDGHFGVDNVMIRPINDIEEIYLKFR